MKKCRSCGAEVRDGQRHHCPRERRTIDADDDSFLVSATVAAVTNSALLGVAVGGDLAGGIVGDLLDGDLFD